MVNSNYDGKNDDYHNDNDSYSSTKLILDTHLFQSTHYLPEADSICGLHIYKVLTVPPICAICFL